MRISVHYTLLKHVLVLEQPSLGVNKIIWSTVYGIYTCVQEY